MNNAIEYPHPVLDSFNNDYDNSSFQIVVLSCSDNGSEISIEIECKLSCNGIIETIESGQAKCICRLSCNRTSLRQIYDLKPIGTTIIRILKKDIVDSFDLQAMVIATVDIRKFSLKEFNQLYFKNMYFDIRKADLLAIEPGLTVKLNTVFEKNMAGIVQVRRSLYVENMEVYFPEISEENAELSQYIVITLKDIDYQNYTRMRTKRYLKHGVERFIQSSLILPVITEAIGRLRKEEEYFNETGEYITQYKGTVWADSIYKALENHGIVNLSENRMTDCEIANLLLNNVVSDSINNLMQKLDEWSTIREDD